MSFRKMSSILLLALTTACSSTGFNRTEMRETVNEQATRVTDTDIEKTIALKPQLPKPFRVAVYFSPPHYQVRGYSMYVKNLDITHGGLPDLHPSQNTELLADLKRAIETIPPSVKHLIEPRLQAIFVVNNFSWAAETLPLYDKSRKPVKAVIIINAHEFESVVPNYRQAAKEENTVLLYRL
jgi:hypothetical protein